MHNWSAARRARVGYCIASGDLDVLSELVAGQEVVPDPRAQVALELGHDGLCLQQYLVRTEDNQTLQEHSIRRLTAFRDGTWECDCSTP